MDHCSPGPRAGRNSRACRELEVPTGCSWQHLGLAGQRDGVGISPAAPGSRFRWAAMEILGWDWCCPSHPGCRRKPPACWGSQWPQTQHRAWGHPFHPLDPLPSQWSGWVGLSCRLGLNLTGRLKVRAFQSYPERILPLTRLNRAVWG